MNVVVITGTHEQPFDRLVAAADHLAAAGHTVFVQYGYASEPPSNADGSMWVERDALERLCARADVIVTHGGPGSIWDAFGVDKVPIVVPRQSRFGEHVDDHQVAFGRHLAGHGRVIVVEDTERLAAAVAGHASAAANCVPPSGAPERHRARLAAALDEWAQVHLARRRRPGSNG